MLRRIPRPSAEICLRCSIRLFHRDTRSLSTSIARNVTDYKREASDYTLQDGDAGSTLDTPKGPFGSSRRLSLKSKNKRRRAGNRLLTEDTAPLDIDMLGKPARAIVLRDGGLYVKKSTIEKVEAEPAPASPDWAALLESQQLDPSAADVFANIESYKPVQERQLSERAFRKLQQTLFNGFKTSQLQGYLQWHASQPPDENSPESMALRLPWVHAITPWVQLAHTSSAASKVDSHLRGYISPSSSPKEKLTIRVLREAWRLSINELATGLGEVTVRLRNTEFTLLMRGTQRFVNLVGKTWLEPGEKIEALNGPKSVRFVIKKPKTDFLLAELDKTLNCIETKTLPLSLVTTEPLGDALIEELGRITNTHIAKSSNGRRIHITWIEVRSPDGKSPLEDLRHVVFRLLLTALAPTRTVTSLSSDHPAKATGRFVRDRTNTSKWAWKERMGEWERFVIPVPSSELTVEAETPAVPLQAPSLSSGPVPKATKNQGGQMFSTDDMTPDRYSDGPSLFPVRWAATVQTSTAAHFGHLLHAAEAYDSTETKAVTVADLTTAGRQRIFSPLIPHPTRLAELELRRSGTSQGSSDLYPAESTILIRFQPSPRTNSSTDEYITADARAGQSKLERRLDKSAYRKEATAKGHEVWPIAPPPAAPTLELRLTIQGTEVLGIQSLRAIKHKELTDVMLPSSLTDIRFTQAQYAELRGDVDAIAAWQPLADFLGHARFDLDRGKVDMPPRQKIPVPRGLFSDFDADESDPNELVGTQYEFVGLELHRAVSMPHRGYTMTYTSIEAGQGGGRRAELSLEAVAMPVPYKSAVSPASHELEPAAQQDASGMVSASETVATALSSGVANEDFLKACYDFARDESIWAGYPGDQRQ